MTMQTQNPFEFEAALTPEAVEELETIAQGEEMKHSINRRFALQILTMSSDELKEKLDDDPDSLSGWQELAESFDSVVKRMKVELDMFETAKKRVDWLTSSHGRRKLTS